MNIHQVIKEELEKIIKEDFYGQFEEDWYHPAGQTLSGIDEEGNDNGYDDSLTPDDVEIINKCLQTLSQTSSILGEIGLHRTVDQIRMALRQLQNDLKMYSTQNGMSEEQQAVGIKYDTERPEQRTKDDSWSSPYVEYDKVGLYRHLENIVREEVKNIFGSSEQG